MTGLFAVRYVGGKSAGASTGTGPWIASLLPYDRDGTYVEPFAGMLGVLLQRPRVKYELANDLDGVVYTFWRAVREYPSELARALELTPSSMREYEIAERTAVDESAGVVERARAFCILRQQSHVGLENHWSPRFMVGVGSRSSWRVGLPARVVALAERMKDVELACEDATATLRRVENHTDAVVYVDPPYEGVLTPYRADVDRGELTDALLAQKGRVLISGYRDEWDHLGWERREHRTWTPIAMSNTGKIGRVEVAWTNYEVGGQGALAI